MKLNGKKMEGGRHKDVIVFPRGTEEPIAFWVQALDDEWEDWEKGNPPPEPPVVRKASGAEKNFEDEGYKQAIENWLLRKSAFMVVASLTIPENDIEWETLDMEKPKTWVRWRDEMKDAGLTVVEINKLIRKISEVNQLSEDLLDQAREDFLRGEQKVLQETTTSLPTDDSSSPSIEPVSVSE